MATITIRTDDALKAKAQEVANQMWLSVSSLVNWFLKKVVRERKVEFTALTENWFTPEYEREILEYSKNDNPNEIVAVCSTDEELDEFFKSLNK